MEKKFLLLAMIKNSMHFYLQFKKLLETKTLLLYIFSTAHQ